MSHHDHHHYEHYSPDMACRLDGFFGDVDAMMNARIARWVLGSRALDIGCGFGHLVDCLRRSGCEAVGIDLLNECVAEGCRRYPLADLRVTRGTMLPFKDGDFDTVIMKDTIHHIFSESCLGDFLSELKRICRKRVIVFDPNPTLVLILSRRLIGHVDPVCSLKDAAKILTMASFRIVHVEFSEVLAFPLSGGYVGRPFIKTRKWAGAIRKMEDSLNALVRAVGLSRHLCWRYLLVADR